MYQALLPLPEILEFHRDTLEKLIFITPYSLKIAVWHVSSNQCALVLQTVGSYAFSMNIRYSLI